MRSCTVRDILGDELQARKTRERPKHIAFRMAGRGSAWRNIHTVASARKHAQAVLQMCDEIEAEATA